MARQTTKLISIRVDEGTFGKLQQDAESRFMSMNGLIKSILSKELPYINYSQKNTFTQC
jgi:hypothetical protein